MVTASPLGTYFVRWGCLEELITTLQACQLPLFDKGSARVERFFMPLWVSPPRCCFRTVLHVPGMEMQIPVRHVRSRPRPST